MRTKSPSEAELLTGTDPARFCNAMLGAGLWRRQRDIQRSAVTNPLTAVKACHASGKTYLMARLGLFWLKRYDDAKLLTTAPTLRQVKLMWEEISIGRRTAQISFPEPTSVGMKFDDDHYGLGASSSRGVNIQGFHGGHILILVDEGPGIQPDIWDAIQGIRSGGDVHMLIAGNPVVPQGEFFDAFKAKSGYERFTISAFDTPNFYCPDRKRQITLDELLVMSKEELAYAPYPWLVRRAWVAERARVWGVDHPKFLSRVLGLFPPQSSFAVFHLAWIEKAKRDATEEEVKRAEGCAIQVGIDVAGGGDDETTLCARVNGVVLEQHAWSTDDPFGEVMKVLRRLRTGILADGSRHPYRLGNIVVDIIGVGYNFALRIADQQGYDVVGFNAGHKAMDPEQFMNAKSEAYWNAREWLRRGLVSGMADEECDSQLTTILYKESGGGRTLIEAKDDARKRGVDSPDRAEAFILAFANIVPREQEYTAPFDPRFVIARV